MTVVNCLLAGIKADIFILFLILDVYHTTFDPPNNPDILRRLEIDPNSQEDVMIKRLLEYHRFCVIKFMSLY